MSVRCFLLEETGRARLGLRRYRGSSHGGCPTLFGYHHAIAYIGETPTEIGADRVRSYPQRPERPPRDDPRWPARCACGEPFAADDEWQLWTEAIYRRADTGEDVTLRDAPPGAMWDAWWLADLFAGPDGRCLMVKLPNGHDWCIDGRASNCTLPDDRAHRCWVRHGTPPAVTVDKNGHTCAAGAGSILSGSYHGFLRDGEFT